MSIMLIATSAHVMPDSHDGFPAESEAPRA